LIRHFGTAGPADQVAVLAKTLFTNSFQAAFEMNASKVKVRRGGFPKD
jgi:hypothetical protein